MGKNIVTRAALGHVADLGDLYDARTDNFCGISIFKRKVPESAMTIHDNHFSDIQLLYEDTFSEKFSKLNVSAELQVSVLAGLFTLQGSGRFLSDQKSSVRTVKSSLLYNIKTKEQKMNIYHEDLKGTFALAAIESGIATHVLVEISWGANCVLTSEFKNSDNRDVKEIEGSLSAHLEKMSLSISGKASVDFKEGDNSKDSGFNIRIFGDILSQNQDLPTTFEEALNLMRQMPSLVKSSNDGRGKPLSYRLIPLSLLTDYLSFEIQADKMLKTLENECLLRVVQIFEDMSQARQQINDFYQDTVDNAFCVAPSDKAEIISFKKQFAIDEAKFRSKLAQTLTSVRSGEADVSVLEGLIENYLNGNYSPDNLAGQFIRWEHIADKTARAKSLVSAGAKYIGYKASLDAEIEKNWKKTAFILYFKQDALKSDKKKWKGSKQLFFQEMKKSADNLYLAVDCDIHPNLWPDHVLIEVQENGKVVIDDLLAVQTQTQSLPLAKCTLKMERKLSKPAQRINLVISCTGHSCKPDVKYNWICAKCKTSIEFGFDQFCYCQCGRGPVTMFEFKCTDPAHGVAFERHDEKFLQELLDRLPLKERNIVLLGETGVEKPTWINALINYLTYDSLQDAEKGELLTLISPEYDEDYGGLSATLERKVYPKIGNLLIRLIEMPGIVETHGIDQDKQNSHNILQTLSCLDELHGIIILLKPNNAQLSVKFQFCIKELLTYFHLDSSHDIMFCFTDATPYATQISDTPKDTMLALEDLLKENGVKETAISSDFVYCYDSDPYRFLAESKNKSDPAGFPDYESLTNSWEKSIKETQRMLKHISKLKPHHITNNNSLSLDQTREVVNQVAVVLAHITRSIHSAKDVIELHLNVASGRDTSLQKEAWIKEQNQELLEFDEELAEIQKASVKLGYFLKHNSIMPYKDPMIFYMDHLISEERGKVAYKRDAGTLKFLQNSRTSYEEQIANLSAKLDHVVVSPDEIDNLIHMLKNLKRTGKCFEDSLKAIIAAGRNVKYQEVTLPRIWRKN